MLDEHFEQYDNNRVLHDDLVRFRSLLFSSNLLDDLSGYLNWGFWVLGILRTHNPRLHWPITPKGVVMETWDAIIAPQYPQILLRSRFSPGDLDRILEAGRRTPSAGNIQPLGLRRRHRRSSARRATAGLASAASSAARQRSFWWLRTLPTPTRELTQYDLGQATMSIMLAATDLGIGTGHSSVDDQDLARRLLGGAATTGSSHG